MMVEKKQINFPRYEHYKDSGIKWIGEIPAHWDTLRGNYIFTVIDERSERGEEDLLSVSEHTGVRYRSDMNVNMFMAESYAGYKICRPNDLVINSLWAWSRGLGVSSYHGIVSTAYSVYRPNLSKVNPSFLNYLLRIEQYISQYLIASKGIWISRLQLSDWRFLRIPILIPPLPEQTAIAQFLDHKTAQIDRAIAIKEAQIKLLNERKQIMIQEAVTKGLDPSVPMKDSGIEWIGEIPAHWEVKKLKYLSSINKESLDDSINKNYLIEYVDIGSVSYENGIERVEKYLFSNAPSRARRIAHNGDTIVSTVRTYLKSIDYIDDAKSKYIFSTGFAVITPKFILYPKYLTAFIGSISFTNQVDIESTGISYPAINSTKLSNLWVVVPPHEVQEKIISVINHVSEIFNRSVSLYKRQIQTLKEYKTTLINEAVTGKIKVY